MKKSIDLSKEFPSALDTAYAQYKRNLASHRKIEEIMTHNVVTIAPENTLYEAARIMGEKHIGSLIVVKYDTPVGIITEKDILERIVKAGRDPRETFAQDIMTAPVIIVDPDMSITDAINLMRQKKVRRLVVFDKVTIGIVTIRRLLEAVVASPPV